jgi:enoyl-CoA hydratase
MSDGTHPGEVRRQIEGRIFKMVIDNVAKRNSFTPDMMLQLSEAMTEFDKCDELWVAVLCAEGEHFTAGIDMPKFLGPGASATPTTEDSVDPFALRNRSIKPIITAVQGITYTLGIELMLAGDIVVAADTARFCQMEAKRGIAPLAGRAFSLSDTHGVGRRDVPSDAVR